METQVYSCLQKPFWGLLLGGSLGWNLGSGPDSLRTWATSLKKCYHLEKYEQCMVYVNQIVNNVNNWRTKLNKSIWHNSFDGAFFLSVLLLVVVVVVVFCDFFYGWDISMWPRICIVFLRRFSWITLTQSINWVFSRLFPKVLVSFCDFVCVDSNMLFWFQYKATSS